MADIVDVQIIKWANERARTLADKMTALYYALTAYQSEYAAQGITAKINAAGASGNIADGSATDGRPVITGTVLLNFKAAIDQLTTSYGTNVSGVGSPITTIINGIQVNGSPK